MDAPVTKRSRFGYDQTVAMLLAAIAGAGGTIFANIDQRGAAASVGLELRPTTLLVFGNPRGGTPLMAAEPLMALDLPLKIAVWEDAQGVSVAYYDASALATRYGLTNHAERVAALDRDLKTLVASVAPPSPTGSV